MPITIEVKLSPEEAASPTDIKTCVAREAGLPEEEVLHIRYLRKSLDARKGRILFLLKAEVYTTGETVNLPLRTFQYQKVSDQKSCHIIGFGPAGIYAALQCLERGIKPIILERGKPVEERLKDISAIHKQGILNPESNYCFGEGGAGTYSDGKLYTRSSKRGDIQKVLDVFIQHGADPRIGYEAHPHIGTNKLPRIIAAMRQTIIENGGEVHFEKKVIGFEIAENKISKIKCADGTSYACRQVILATGHSSRDIFELLHRQQITLEAKPFALGVRIEHSQDLIDHIQYKQARGLLLPPSSYSLVTQACGRGVFSFCMCPGGVIAPAATAAHETVVNGWSSSARNGPFANSGLVVSVNPENWTAYEKHGVLAALQFQKEVEQKAYSVVNSLQAPAQRVEDFIQNKVSNDLPRTSYQPGIVSHDLAQILPSFITRSLREALVDFGKKMNGYRTNEAIVVGVESRTSSPVRIPRSKETFRHPQLQNLFPCGEGAGFAGGIVSAAMDGMACANAL
ncbi:MAG: NAD(P)/FAD-dependent oxidoreductase [Bacteroidetes bacterium]|nr:NAD(P)/FAD-dependent oxidoreductase [Bacteroidota bacterium]